MGRDQAGDQGKKRAWNRKRPYTISIQKERSVKKADTGWRGPSARGYVRESLSRVEVRVHIIALQAGGKGDWLKKALHPSPGRKKNEGKGLTFARRHKARERQQSKSAISRPLIFWVILSRSGPVVKTLRKTRKFKPEPWVSNCFEICTSSGHRGKSSRTRQFFRERESV